MDERQQKELRYAMETQYRYKFYNSPEFPFLPSIGIKHVFQGFEIKEEEFGYIGMLHLWWTNEDNKIEYDNPRYFVKGTWHGEWLDDPKEGIKKATQIQKENTLLDVNKLFKVHYDFHQEIQKKQAERNFNEETEEMASIISKQKLPN